MFIFKAHDLTLNRCEFFFLSHHNSGLYILQKKTHKCSAGNTIHFLRFHSNVLLWQIDLPYISLFCDLNINSLFNVISPTQHKIFLKYHPNLCKQKAQITVRFNSGVNLHYLSWTKSLWISKIKTTFLTTSALFLST